MSYRDRLSKVGTAPWSIPLGTHLGTNIPNETSVPQLSLAGSRLKTEDSYRATWTSRRSPIAGYNCFGHVFACRRTALYGDADIEEVLCEDGFGEIHNEADWAPGDVVVYFDDDGPMHAGELVRFDHVPIGLMDGPQEPQARVPIVLSKLDDVSGEYEHKLAEYTGTHGESLTFKVYRARHSAPSRKPPGGWRGMLASLAGSSSES